MNNKLYVDQSIEPKISVLDADTLAVLFSLTVPGLRCVLDFNSCDERDEVYRYV